VGEPFRFASLQLGDRQPLLRDNFFGYDTAPHDPIGRAF